MNLADIWRRIDKWLELNANDVFANLAPSASVEDLRNLDSSLGFRMPASIKQLLEIHNGETEEEAWVLSTWALLSADEIVHFFKRELTRAGEDRTRVDSDVEVRPILWSKGWIPFAADGSGGFLAIDIDPAERGITGQVIRTAHDDGNSLVAADIETLFARFLSCLESGVFEFIDDGIEAKTGFSDWWRDSN